ncbi:MAG: peptidoglycan bridge formation glycyltransferase FemA/FemB family protein [Anaerolineae bacterium]
MWGVYRFKQGFGGEVVRYVGTYDYVYSPISYWLYNKAVAWRRSMG